MKKWDKEFESYLLEALNYRDFLNAFFRKDGGWSHPRPLSFQEFASKSGFAAKSFINDVIAGRKRITPNSLNRVAHGLGLAKIWTEYLECLVAIEESKFHSRQKNGDYFRSRIGIIKKNLMKRSAAKSFGGNTIIANVFLETHFPEVYAALGVVDQGEKLQTIIDRTRLHEAEVISILSKMESAGVLFRKGDCYLPSVEALEGNDLKSNGVFQKDFLRSIEKMKKRFPRQADSGSTLFMTQTFSVLEKDLAHFRNQLADLITNFSSDTENPTGDCIAEICIGFTNTATQAPRNIK